MTHFRRFSETGPNEFLRNNVKPWSDEKRLEHVMAKGTFDTSYRRGNLPFCTFLILFHDSQGHKLSQKGNENLRNRVLHPFSYTTFA